MNEAVHSQDYHREDDESDAHVDHSVDTSTDEHEASGPSRTEALDPWDGAAIAALEAIIRSAETSDDDEVPTNLPAEIPEPQSRNEDIAEPEAEPPLAESVETATVPDDTDTTAESDDDEPDAVESETSKQIDELVEIVPESGEETSETPEPETEPPLAESVETAMVPDETDTTVESDDDGPDAVESETSEQIAEPVENVTVSEETTTDIESGDEKPETDESEVGEPTVGLFKTILELEATAIAEGSSNEGPETEEPLAQSVEIVPESNETPGTVESDDEESGTPEPDADESSVELAEIVPDAEADEVRDIVPVDDSLSASGVEQELPEPDVVLPEVAPPVEDSPQVADTVAQTSDELPQWAVEELRALRADLQSLLTVIECIAGEIPDDDSDA